MYLFLRSLTTPLSISNSTLANFKIEIFKVTVITSAKLLCSKLKKK